jgi:hypothetical protein
MGWLFYERKTNQTVREHLDEKLTWDSEIGKYKVLKSAMVGSTYYAAVERIQADTRTVFAAVFLTQSRPRATDGMTFGYKDMDESDGPTERKCPVSILNLLTETIYEYAKQWREDCRAYAQKKKQRPKIGQTIQFQTPIKFGDGYEGDRFQVANIIYKGRNLTVYKNPDGRPYRITNIEQREFTVVSEQPQLA